MLFDSQWRDVYFDHIYIYQMSDGWGSMLKPDSKEMARALEVAEYMREHDLDRHHIAKALLYLVERNAKLEKVMSSAEVFLHFGQGVSEHSTLLRAISSAKRMEDSATRLIHEIPSSATRRRAY